MKSFLTSILLVCTLSTSFLSASAARPKAADRKPVETPAVVTDYSKESIKTVRDSAQAGNVAALREMGYRYFNGADVEKNNDRAVKYWSKAAQEGDAESVARLGFCFMDGIGVTPNREMAGKLFDRAVDMKYNKVLDELDAVAPTNPAAALYLAGRYSLNGGMPMPGKENREKLEGYLKMASDAGSAEGTRRLGLLYMNTKKYQAAKDVFAKGASLQDPTSLYFTGLLSGESRFGLPVNPTDAVVNMRAAADAGYPQALFMLASWYDTGNNVTQDYVEAARYYREAAAAGNDRARWTMGLHRVKGVGCTADFNIGLNWLTSTNPKVYTKTFKNLFADTATVLEGTRFGDFIQAVKSLKNGDYADARTRFKALDKARNKQAATYLALCDFSDPKVKYTEKKLVKALQKASKKGDAYAKYLLADYYINQSTYDRDEIVKLLNEAADLGLGQAYATLGMIAAEGRIIPTDYAAAAADFEKAFILGGLDNKAAAVYADILENGRGDIQPDAAKAAMMKTLNPDDRSASFLNAVPTAIN